ncbi:hypothetical protein ACVIIZ_008056 [Bradyrhizobium sp. USDA 4523]|nr:hypothetical protein [Bradyrhizobium sp. USDA 4538]MCP1902321.1 hypothetical protein [Bradyrhizobium sp. USDA 4537]
MLWVDQDRLTGRGCQPVSVGRSHVSMLAEICGNLPCDGRPVKVTDAPRPLPTGGSQAIHSRTGALASLCSSRAVLPPSPQPGPRSLRRWGRLAATFSRFVSATQPTATTASEASASNRAPFFVKTMRTPAGVFANASMVPKLSYPERYGVICHCLAAHADACDFVESREAMPSPATSTIERLRCEIQPEVS